MITYANHVNGSMNKDTGETIVRFFQITPGITILDNAPKIEGMTAEMVASVVMDKATACDLFRILNNFLNDSTSTPSVGE